MKIVVKSARPKRNQAKALIVGTSVLILNASVHAIAWAHTTYSIDGGQTEEIPSTKHGDTLEVAQALYVGKNGTGTLNIRAGGTARSGTGEIGYEPGSNGTVLVEGKQATWENTGSITVGDQGDGSLTIGADGHVKSSGLVSTIAHTFDATGTVTVHGENARWENSAELHIGYGGKGELNITDGGLVENTVGVIGRDLGSTGAVIVAGENSRWNNSNYLVVGSYGRGALAIKDGGTVSAGNYLLLGRGNEGILNLETGGLLQVGGADGLRAERPRDAIFNLAGGTLQVHGEHLTSSIDASLSNASTINTNGLNGTLSGILTGTGSLNKVGLGLLTLTGNNTYAGGTQIANGTLQIGDGGTTGTIVGDVSSHGTLAFNRSDNVTFDGRVSGSGSLVQTGPGTLTLTGNNTYTGGTQLLGGTLSVSRDANLGARSGEFIFNGGVLRITGDDFIGTARNITWGDHGGGFDIEHYAPDESHIFTVSSDISGNGDLLKRGKGALRLTGANAYGNTLIQEGDLYGDARSISGNVHVDTGGTLTFNQNQDATFHNAIEGVGQFNKTGPGTLYLTGNSAAFLGSTTISGGTLSVGGPTGTGVLSSKVDVADGGTLAGNGIVGRPGSSGQVTVASGGTIAPGNSIGTLVVNGDLTLAHGSRYVVEVDPGGTASDLIDVAGTAMLEGGSVVHIGADGTYRPQASYRILSAGTGLTGAFGKVSSDFAFLTPDLVYDYDDYTVDLALRRNDASFASLAHTPNQVATARGLESLPQSSGLLQRILTLPNDTPAAAFDALSGEIHATTASGIATGSATARALPLAHLRASLAAGQLPGALLAQADGTLPASALPQSAALPLWAEVIGSRQRMASDGNAGALKQSTGGVFLGGDLGVGQGWRLGAALGYTDSSIRVDDRDGKADITSYSASLYGGKAFDLGVGQLNLLAGGAYSWHDIETTRQASVADWNHTLKADYRAHTHQLFAELGYAVPLGRTTIEPFAGLAWTKLRTRGFAESGGPTALSGQSQSDDLATSTLGVRASTHMELGKAQGRLHATLGWRHAFGRAAPQRTMSFDGSQAFTVAGTPIARDSAVVELGADVALTSTAKVGLAYNGQLGGGNRHHAGKINVQWRF